MNIRDTSLEAYESILKDLSPMRRRVMEVILKAGKTGRTCDEIEVYLGGRHQTVSARCGELEKLNLIRDSGTRRPTRSGRRAIVWLARTFWEPSRSTYRDLFESKRNLGP